MWLLKQKLLTAYRVFGILVVISTLAFNKVFFLTWKRNHLQSFGENWKREDFMWLCSTMIYSQHGVGYEEGKGLKKKKLNNFIEPLVWCCYSRTLLFALEWIPRGADSILVRCQYKNTITRFKAQAFLRGSVSLDCSPFCFLLLIQMTNIYL